MKNCSIEKKCGGCQYSGMSYEKELSLKQEEITKLLAGFTKVEPVIGMKAPLYYRNKVHHVFAYDRKKGAYAGCYEEKSHRVVPIEECLIEDKKSQEIIGTIRDLCRSFKIKIYDEDTGYGLLRHVLVRRGFQSGEIMVVLVLSDQILPGKNNFVKALRDAHPEITTIVLNVNGDDTSMVLGQKEKVLFGPGYIKDRLLGFTYRISPSSFYQVNPVQTEVLYQKAVEFAGLTGKETVLDAYCGIGTIGISASKKAKRVIGVELNPEAVKDAKLNASENRIENIRFICSDATKWMEACEEKIDVIFMDPPRSGSTNEFIHSVKRLGPEKVVYVSCGPDTLRRDLEEFNRCGYEVKKIQPVDMFPRTKHVETVVLMSKVNTVKG